MGYLLLDCFILIKMREVCPSITGLTRLVKLPTFMVVFSQVDISKKGDDAHSDVEWHGLDIQWHAHARIGVQGDSDDKYVMRQLHAWWYEYERSSRTSATNEWVWGNSDVQGGDGLRTRDWLGKRFRVPFLNSPGVVLIFETRSYNTKWTISRCWHLATSGGKV